jgi:hypothetical protein
VKDGYAVIGIQHTHLLCTGHFSSTLF